MFQFDSLTARKLFRAFLVAAIPVFATQVLPVVEAGDLPTVELLEAAGAGALGAGFRALLVFLPVNDD